MSTKIDIALQSRTPGCFLRDMEKTDVVDTFYTHKGIFVLCGKSETNRQVQDWAAERLLQQNRIDAQTVADYKEQVCTLFHDAQLRSAEQLDAAIQKLRCTCFGEATMEALHREMMQEPCAFDMAGGIDQRAKKDEVLQNASAVLFVCDDARMVLTMQEDVLTALQEGKDVYVLTHPKQGMDIACEANLKAQLEDEHIQYLLLSEDMQTVHAQDDEQAEYLNAQIAQGKAALLFYGESGLLACRDLALDAIVHAVPQGYYARALTNQFDVDRACVVYVPKGMDVTKDVPLRERTRLNYHHLYTLWKTYGDGIYACSAEWLYRKYPQHFLNIYDNSISPVEAMPEYPIRLAPDAQNLTMLEYDALREEAIAAYLSGVENLEYRTGYIDENNNIHPVNHDADRARPGVMVHSVKVKKAKSSSVINCEAYASVRAMIRAQMNGGLDKLRIYSNFLFFLTPVLARLYNALRSDRPREQIDFEKQHLDYMLVRDEGKRTETFPLFKKACIAMKADGTFLFFNFRLGGGRIRLGKTELCWSREDVDPENMQGRSVCVLTPYQSNRDLQEDTSSYTKLVGEGRINLVIIQDRIICMRRDSVLLPSIGVVLSLDEETGMQIIRENGLCLNADGYSDGHLPAPEVQLDPPDGISPDEWAQVAWAYGGGLSLILDGKGICDEDGPGMLKYLEEEGWMSPLSRQTQESALHLPARHPRTAIGVTDSGELVILVYSGRTRRSGGADYAQMIAVARKLYPDILHLMNADGGGSAMLGMSIGNSFMELSYPSTSLDSCAGMVRPVNTALCIEMTGMPPAALPTKRCEPPSFADEADAI